VKYIIGIDEVGRGPLAGPVTVAAVALPLRWHPRKGQGRLSLKDSKKLSQIQRNRWSEYLLKHPKVRYVIAKHSPKQIDAVNISKAANSAAKRAFLKLSKDCGIRPEDCVIYLDGGLYLGNGKKRLPANTMVKADQKIVAVRIASIFAKVHRDRLMDGVAKKYPGYGFERHKGYGTRAHYEAIGRLGITKIHRLTFVSSYGTIEAN
jgi:ribonuclease HII